MSECRWNRDENTCPLHGRPVFKVGMRVAWNRVTDNAERRGVVVRLSHSWEQGWLYHVKADGWARSYCSVEVGRNGLRREPKR